MGALLAMVFGGVVVWALLRRQELDPRPEALPAEPEILGSMPSPSDIPENCPVCGWYPCTDTCLIGLSGWEQERLEGWLEENDAPGDTEDGDGPD